MRRFFGREEQLGKLDALWRKGAKQVKLFTTGERPLHASCGGAGFVTNGKERK